MKKHKNGFTLVEVITVLVIVMIMAVIAVPNVTGYIDNSKRRNCNAVAQTLINDIAMSSVATRFMYGTAEYPYTYYNLFVKQMVASQGIEYLDNLSVTTISTTSYSITAPICPNGESMTIEWSFSGTTKTSGNVSLKITCTDTASELHSRAYTIAFKGNTNHTIIENIIPDMETYRAMIKLCIDVMDDFRYNRGKYSINLPFTYNGVEYTSPVKINNVEYQSMPMIWNNTPLGKYHNDYVTLFDMYIKCLVQNMNMITEFAGVLNEEYFEAHDIYRSANYSNEMDFFRKYMHEIVFVSENVKQTLTVDNVTYDIIPYVHYTSNMLFDEENVLYFCGTVGSNENTGRIKFFYHKEDKCWYEYTKNDNGFTLAGVSASRNVAYLKAIVFYNNNMSDFKKIEQFEIVTGDEG